MRVRIKAGTHRRFPIGKAIEAAPIGDPQQGLFELLQRRPGAVTESPAAPKPAPLNPFNSSLRGMNHKTKQRTHYER